MSMIMDHFPLEEIFLPAGEHTTGKDCDNTALEILELLEMLKEECLLDDEDLNEKKDQLISLLKGLSERRKQLAKEQWECIPEELFLPPECYTSSEDCLEAMNAIKVQLRRLDLAYSEKEELWGIVGGLARKRRSLKEVASQNDSLALVSIS
jgi:hypothetical protein